MSCWNRPPPSPSASLISLINATWQHHLCTRRCRQLLMLLFTTKVLNEANALLKPGEHNSVTIITLL